MKTILVPFNQDGLPKSVLETACAFARRFESYVEGVPFDFVPSEYVAVDLFGGGWVPPSDTHIAETSRASRDSFEKFMTAAGFARDAGEMKPQSFGWREPARQQLSLAALSRIFDITVFARPSPPALPSLRIMLEATLFEGGRAILVAPPTAPKSIGERVVIAWNYSTETARTVALAMPALMRAEKITVLTITGGTVPGPTGLDLCRALRVHGLPVDERTVAPGTRSTGEAMLEEAARLGCDLLIKGAYTQSRLRQMIFGGATSHILNATEMPVFMAH
ncbi:MAG: universal stress protein [Hyphomicrobiaceae bacterium]